MAEIGGGLGCDAQEDVSQVGVGVDAVAPGAPDEGAVDGCGAAAVVASQEQPIFTFMHDARNQLCPPVYPPSSALRSLSSGALSSELVQRGLTRKDETHKMNNSGSLALP